VNRTQPRVSHSESGGYDGSDIAAVFFEAATDLGFEVQVISGAHGVGVIRRRRRELVVHGRWLGINDLTATMLCSEKHYSTSCLMSAGLPVPEATVAPCSAQVTRPAAARALIEAASGRYPVCIKPVSGSHGFQVVPDIRDEDELLWVLYSDPGLAWSDMLVESQQAGRHYRVVVAFGEVIGCVERRAPLVVGDGRRRLEELFEAYNASRRAQSLDIVSFGPRQAYIVNRRHGLARQSVVPAGVDVILDDRCNLKVGGTIHYIPPGEVAESAGDLCVRAASLFDLEFAGLDLIGDDIRKGDGGRWVINEVNSQPAAHVPVPTMTRHQRLQWPKRLLSLYFDEAA